MRRVAVLMMAMAVMLVGLAAPATGVPASTVGPVEVVATFDASQGELPEGVALDKPGNIYVSLGPPFFAGGGYGEIRQIDPDGTETTLVEYLSGPAPAGLAVDAPGNVYFAVPDLTQAAVGVYRVTDDSSAEPLPRTKTEPMLVPNGLAIDKRGNVFASDSVIGAIWRYPRGGTTPAEIWKSDEPLLAGCEAGELGANGIAFWKGDLYVANTARGALVRIPVSNDGAPGIPTIIAGDKDCDEDDPLYSLDGIAFDVHGDVYASLVLQNKLVRIDPEDGTPTPLLGEEDGLWNPASLAFGTGKGDRQTLFIANYAVLPPKPAGSPGPAILKVDVGVPGLPLP
jgi:sugar lactone lactonase YvrE